MSAVRQFLFFIARLFLSAVFLIAAFSHLADFDGMESSLTNALYAISEHSSGMVWLQTVVQELLPFVSMLCIISLGLLVIGGLCVLLGIKYRLGAWLLIIFLTPVTFIMHHFFFLEGMDRVIQATMFWKNLAIIGGLLTLATHPKSPEFVDG